MSATPTETDFTTLPITMVVKIKRYMQNGDVMNMVRVAARLKDVMEQLHDDERHHDIAEISEAAKVIA